MTDRNGPPLTRVKVEHCATRQQFVIEDGAFLHERRFEEACARLLDLDLAHVRVEYDLGAGSGRVLWRQSSRSMAFRAARRCTG